MLAEEERNLGLFVRMAGGGPEIKYIEIGEPPFQQDLTILDEESIKRLKVGAIVSVGKTRV